MNESVCYNVVMTKITAAKKKKLKEMLQGLVKNCWDDLYSYKEAWTQINLVPEEPKCICIIRPNNSSVNELSIHVMEKNISSLIPLKANDPDIFFLEYTQYHELLFFANYSDIREIVDIATSYFESESVDYRIGISSDFSNVHGLSLAYNDATSALTQTTPDDKIRFYVQQKNFKTGMDINSTYNDTISRLITCLDKNELAPIPKILTGIFDDIRYGKPNECMHICLGIINKIANHFDLYAHTNFLVKYRFDLFRDANTITYGIRSILYDNLFQINQVVATMRESGVETTSLATKMKAIAEENYSDSCFSLLTIAESLNLSYSYLSSVFKAQTGTNFSKYITNVRMEHAKLFLADPTYKISNIASAVGYRDTGYFITVFKKYFKLSPGEYRLQFLKIER